MPIKKKKLPPVVVETILFKINAKLHEVLVKFVSDKKEISLFAIKGITTEIIVKKPYTQLKAKLNNLIISDLNPQSVHKEVLVLRNFHVFIFVIKIFLDCKVFG